MSGNSIQGIKENETMTKIKVGVVIPDRKDRPRFLRQCLLMLNRQTRKADFILVVDGNTGLKKDLTLRYKTGFGVAFGKGECDVVFLIENDDWYSSRFIETMLQHWNLTGRPDILGIGRTVYYHLGQRRYKIMTHKERASAFCTMVTKKVLGIVWPDDSESFLDLHLWQQLKGVTVLPEEEICIGIKHGIGTCGGRAHKETFPYDFEDKELAYLSATVDKQSLEFYKSL